MNDVNKITFAIVFVLISLFLFNIKPVIPVFIFNRERVDPLMEDIYVPPAENSHPKCCPDIGRLSVPNDWENLAPSNNMPGLLPGPRHGEQLGLENNPDLSLSSPIRAPLLENFSPNKCNTQDNYANRVKSKILKGCLRKATTEAKVLTMPARGYYKYRYQQCNPYNGSYCQCTNNYVPLPPVGLCQENGWSEDVCPYKYRVRPSKVYLGTQKCLKN